MEEKKKRLRAELLRWHPDKFQVNQTFIKCAVIVDLLLVQERKSNGWLAP